jgi:hypothetical protein
MRTSNVWKLIAIASTLGMMLSLACHASVAVNSASAEQPHMQSARDHLQAAKAELQAADPNKGGHRENAMGLCDQAIAEVNAGIEYARTH